MQPSHHYIGGPHLSSLHHNYVTVGNVRDRRLFAPCSTNAPLDETTEKIAADPIISAVSNTEPINTVEVELISLIPEPEHKPLHTKITAKYTSSITIPHDSMEDTETAEEYVAKAMGIRAISHQQYNTDEKQSQQQDYNQYSAHPTFENDPKQKIKEHLQAQIQEQIHQAQQLVKDKEQVAAPQVQQNEADDSPSPVYEKDPVTRSIKKNTNENEDRIRVSASTEIPKAEIMKQIEQSVIKYMKELEAEGKIIAAPQNQEPKTYFKVITIPGTDEKRIASTTIKPTKYISSSSGSYPESYKHLPSHSGTAQSQKYHKNPNPKSNYQSENENTYQTSTHDVAELTPNVEFIYKIKTKAPLHTATVKTVSKPYNLPIKSYDQFDHSSALKNLEEFDLSHVVTTPDPEDHQSASSNKPNKLQSTDYKGYSASTSQSGYYAEPPSDRETDRDPSTSNISEDGYPLMNPYQHILKKEVIPTKYDDSNSSYDQQHSNSHVPISINH
ncbi:hypothetical protein DOY81_012356 [Sarcophaga bullata]|nr:hypothetical protein DOY81_012356 [Sarcophaga bullata]